MRPSLPSHPARSCATASNASSVDAPERSSCSASTASSDSICTGGFVLDVEFSATRVRELCKMDGAVVLDREGTRILRAATQLVPDSSIETTESGTRHRTAERVAKQTGFPVISVSQSMGVVALYVGDLRHVIEGSPTTLSRADQALQTLERYKARLDEVTGTLSALEIEDLVTIRDVTAVLQRLEMVRRISAEIQDYVVELGTDGRLLSLQLEELVGGLGNDRELVIRDYLPATKSGPQPRRRARQPPGAQLRRAARPRGGCPRRRLLGRRRQPRRPGVARRATGC